MPKSDLVARLRASYPATTLGSHEARIAIAVTLAVSLCVVGLARLPLRGDLAVDLREGDRIGGAVQTTLIGFSFPDASGRSTVGPLARIVFNRPLPSEFVLEVEGRLQPAAGEAGIDIQIGRFHHGAGFTASLTRQEIRVRNPARVREIALHLVPGATLVLQRIWIRPEDDVG